MYWRIVENQSQLYEDDITSSTETADALRELIENSKPEVYFAEWHDLIATQFRYPVPVGEEYGARFKKPGTNTHAIYGSKELETMYFEHAYYFTRFRAGMDPFLIDRADLRNRFAFDIINSKSVKNISKNKKIIEIMNPNSYLASWEYVENNPQAKAILYPSARDPDHRLNIAVLDIKMCKKEIYHSESVRYRFNPETWEIEWDHDKIKIDCKKTFPELFK